MNGSSTMQPVRIGTATRTLFGEGARAGLSHIIAAQGDARVLIVASASALRRAEIIALARSVERVAHVAL
jgi:hypothetical protein